MLLFCLPQKRKAEAGTLSRDVNQLTKMATAMYLEHYLDSKYLHMLFYNGSCCNIFLLHREKIYHSNDWCSQYKLLIKFVPSKNNFFLATILADFLKRSIEIPSHRQSTVFR